MLLLIVILDNNSDITNSNLPVCSSIILYVLKIDGKGAAFHYNASRDYVYYLELS